MAMFSITDKTKAPYNFSNTSVAEILKKHFPVFKMQAGEPWDICKFTYITHFHEFAVILVHRHDDGAVLVWEPNSNWEGLTYDQFLPTSDMSSVQVCSCIEDLQDFLGRLANAIEKSKLEYRQVSMEYVMFNGHIILGIDGKPIRLPYNSIKGNYRYNLGDFAVYADKIKKYHAALHVVREELDAIGYF